MAEKGTPEYDLLLCIVALEDVLAQWEVLAQQRDVSPIVSELHRLSPRLAAARAAVSGQVAAFRAAHAA